MLCYAMLCYAMLCCAMLCYAMLCYAGASRGAVAHVKAHRRLTAVSFGVQRADHPHERGAPAAHLTSSPHLRACSTPLPPCTQAFMRYIKDTWAPQALLRLMCEGKRLEASL
jgi:hypothetical protein